MRFVFLPNKIELIASIEFGNRTHRTVRLCSITEPVEQQSDRLGSIEFDRFLVRFRSISSAGFIKLVLCLSIDNGEVVNKTRKLQALTCNVKLAKGKI